MACAEAFSAVAGEAFFRGRPADRVLAAILRANRKCGSRDRRLIIETVFSGFRWWGAGRLLLPPALGKEFSSRFDPDAGTRFPGGWPGIREAARVLLFGAVMDNLPQAEALGQLAEIAGCGWLPPEVVRECAAAASLGARLETAARFFKVPGGRPPAPADLLPEWILPALEEGTDSERLLNWLQRRPPMWLRCQQGTVAALLDALRKEGLEPAPHGRVAAAVSVGNPRVNLYDLGSFRDGRFEVQDLASQMIGLVCAPKPGERWWDACAGAGGKSLQLACIMERKGTVVASDIRAYKLDDLRKRARRAALPNIQCRPWDGGSVDRKRATFDGVLVDAPCSCTGTWRRNPAARWQTEASQVAKMADMQAEIVGNACSGLKPGGVLVYATCSICPQENGRNVQKILAGLPLRLEAFANPLTGTPTDGTLQIWPWDGDCDAMFAARFRKMRG